MTQVELAAPAVTEQEPAAAIGRRWRAKPGALLTYAVLIILAIFFIAPIVWMISTSLKAGMTSSAKSFIDLIAISEGIPPRPMLSTM